MIATTLIAAAFIGSSLSSVSEPTNKKWLDELDMSLIEQDWGHARSRKTVDNHPIAIAGKKFERGIGTHAASEFTIELGAGAETFHAFVGVDDECPVVGTVAFVVFADDKEVARTPVLKQKQTATPIDVNIKGAKRLTLAVEDGGDGINYDHADWADAYVGYAANAGGSMKIARTPQIDMPISMAKDGPEPKLHYPRITGASPKKPFLFRVPVTGDPSYKFTVKGLPPGLTMNGSIISGALETEGRWDVDVTVTSEKGTDHAVFTIVGAKNAIALTPPMGWNSWNCWAGAVDEKNVRNAAGAIAVTGFAGHGYQYINIDDTWEAGRDAKGMIKTNERFPNMRALADSVHAHGLKLGIYSSPGPKTCAGYEGSYQHELKDAQQYAAWGIDYLKYDWCSYGDIVKNPDRAALMKPYEIMRDALRAQDRDILYSLCQYGMGNVWEWGAQVGGNCWRTTGDITDSWGSMAGIGFAQIPMAAHAGPGHWNDPDMLVVGRVGWGPSLHPTKLTHNEQITHVTLWSMLAAPLLIGCDLVQIDDFTRALLTNDDMIRVNQDPLGKQATRKSQKGQTEVWTKPMADGSVAVGLFNRGRSAATISVTMTDLGLGGKGKVRNAWMRTDLPIASEVSAEVQSHGAAMFIVTPE